jgi:hypothetical protein
MKTVCIAFKILNVDEALPPRDFLSYDIFNVNMEDFCRKTRFVAGVHTTDTPQHDMTYTSVVS